MALPLRLALLTVVQFGLGRLNHVAIAVPDLKASTALYRDILGAKVSGELVCTNNVDLLPISSLAQPLPEHGVTTVFVELDNTKLELLEPLGEDSPIGNFIKKKPSGGIHHVCIEVRDRPSCDQITHSPPLKVKDVYKAVEELEAQGVEILNREPKIGAHGKPVIFLHPKCMNGVLLELEQV
jgi:methylmalonyl-CoA/ethylmalonyl-CoA epimerase